MNEKWATADTACSGEIVKWLCSVYPGGQDAVTATVRHNDRWCRRWLQWRRETDLQVDVTEILDGFLTYLGMSLSMAPDSVFKPAKARPKGRHRKPLTPAERKKVLKIAKRDGAKAAAEAVSATERTVRKILEKERETSAV